MKKNHKIKVLWCDRNIRSRNINALLSEYDHIALSVFESPVEAKKALEADDSYRLIISGNLFENSQDGFQFFKSLKLSGPSPQFLLFTGEVVSDKEPCLILDNFTYFHKDNYTPLVFEQLIEELIHKSIPTEDCNSKLAAIRINLGLTEGQFSSLINVSPDTVLKFERAINVPSSYVVAICNRFDIPFNVFSNLPLEQFKKRLEDKSLIAQKTGTI